MQRAPSKPRLFAQLADRDADLVRRMIRDSAALEFGNLSRAANALGLGYKQLLKFAHDLGMEHELDALRFAARVRTAILPQPRHNAVLSMKRGGPRGVR
jgi:hypothetical protein